MSGPLNLLINMDGAHERLSHFHAQAAQAGLAFERVAAVNGRAMSEEELDLHRDPAAIYPLSAAEVGIALSHRRAWQSIVDAGVPWGSVFEDDACLQAQTGALLAALPTDFVKPTIVNLEATNGDPVALSKKTIRFCGRDLFELRGVSIGAAGYAINRAACLLLLAQPTCYATALDLYLFSRRFGAVDGIDVFKMDPAPVIQADRLMTTASDMGLGSSVSDRGKRLRPKPVVSKMLRREIYRLREQVRSIGAQWRVIPWG